MHLWRRNRYTPKASSKNPLISLRKAQRTLVSFFEEKEIAPEQQRVPWDTAEWLVPLPQQSAKGSTVSYSFLKLAVMCGSKALPLIAWALDTGARPEHYTYPNTALGLCVYEGQSAILRLFHERGHDILLEVLPQHTTQVSMHYSTVLHRLARRLLSKKQSDKHDYQGTSCYLIDHMPLEKIFQRDGEGYSAFELLSDFPDLQARILARQCAMEHGVLAETLANDAPLPEQPRKRL